MNGVRETSSLPPHWRTPFELGCSIFPVEFRGKRSLVKWQGYQSQRASLDQVCDWAATSSNVGIVTGIVSGVVVLDLDSPEAIEKARALGLPDTVTVRTGKGLHVYFRHPGGVIGNRANVLPGTDFRGDGGYVVAPGSVHETGFVYEWENAPGLFALADMPEWLVALLAKPEPAEPVRAPATASNAYGDKALDDELALLRRAANGSRNHQLNRSAFALAQLAAGGSIDGDKAKAHLRSTASIIGLDNDEIEATLASAWRAGSAEPRGPAEYPPVNLDAMRPVWLDALPTIRASDLAGRPIPLRAWHVEDMIPARTVTLLGGDGGTGKSLLALQLAVATATGTEWIGSPVTKGACLYLTAEDDADEVHRRLASIAVAQVMGLDQLAGLALSSLAGRDALLATAEGRSGLLTPTALYEALRCRLNEDRPALVVLDTLADLFPGDENQRAQVRQFVGLLRALAIDFDAAVLLLAHPSLTGISSGSGLSGSTAWNNSVRSRLYLKRDENDPDARILQTMKANYGRTGQEIHLRWERGRFVEIGRTTGSHAEVSKAEHDVDQLFLSLLAQFTGQGRVVSPHASSPDSAPRQFAGHPSAKGITKRAFIAAMDRLFALGLIYTTKSDGPPSRQKDILALANRAGGPSNPHANPVQGHTIPPANMPANLCGPPFQHPTFEPPKPP